MKLGAGYPMGPFELLDYTGLDLHKVLPNPSCKMSLAGQAQNSRSDQCWGSVTFWCGSVPLTSGSGSVPDSDPTPFFTDF